MKRRTFIHIAVMTSAFWRPMVAKAKQTRPINDHFIEPSTTREPHIEQKPMESETIIKVIGVGGAGGNAVDLMIRRGIRGVDFIVADTDAAALERSLATQRIQLGRSGFGAGAHPEAGRAAALEAHEQIHHALMGAHMVFIVAGMGGGTGTGAAPLVAEIASRLGALPAAAVTTPFYFERYRMPTALSGIAELHKHVASPIVVNNEKSTSPHGENRTVVDAFDETNQLLCDAVGGIVEMIISPSLVCLDFEDVRTTLLVKGLARVGSASSAGSDRARCAAEQALGSPFLSNIAISEAQGLLVSITAARGLKMREINEVMKTVRTLADEDAPIIFSAVYDDRQGESMRVTVVATSDDR